MVIKNMEEILLLHQRWNTCPGWTAGELEKYTTLQPVGQEGEGRQERSLCSQEQTESGSWGQALGRY